MQELELRKELAELFNDHYRNARKWKKVHGGKVIGYYPVPGMAPEIISAAGILPVSIWGKPRIPGHGGAHLPDWSCSLARESLDALLSGTLYFLDGLVVPVICDTTKMFLSIFKQTADFPFLENLVIPCQLGRESSKAGYIAELQRFLGSLEDFVGHEITDQSLQKAIALSNANRALLRRLCSLVREQPGQLPLKCYFELCELNMFMPSEQYTDLLAKVVDYMEKNKRQGKPEKIPLLCIGKNIRPMEIWDLIEEAGGMVIDDLIYGGAANFVNDVRTNLPPLEALAEYWLNRFPFDSFFLQDQLRTDELVGLVKNSGVRGVLMINREFCEAQNFNYPIFKDALEEAGIPCLRLETGMETRASGQIKTRIEAFLEMLA